ncbi:MAG: ankyrin repeat domain-containing protein [Alphaproteobacteria bacterium]|nr:ankyrin repeat domain-containing protein [Alphaproteobacteria bacterium]
MGCKSLKYYLGAMACIGVLAGPLSAAAQTAPSAHEISQYRGIHAAVARGDISAVLRLVQQKRKAVNARDPHGRTPLMVAGYKRDVGIATALIAAGADVDARDSQAYDLMTIAAVANDVQMLKLAIASGGNTGLVTSPYDGTALIAAAHLGHVEVVQTLIDAKAPLDHVNNLKWTALIEAIVLGDGGKNHIACLKALVDAGANVNLPDGEGVMPLTLARRHGFTEMVKILEKAGARP